MTLSDVFQHLPGSYSLLGQKVKAWGRNSPGERSNGSFSRNSPPDAFGLLAPPILLLAVTGLLANQVMRGAVVPNEGIRSEIEKTKVSSVRLGLIKRLVVNPPDKEKENLIRCLPKFNLVSFSQWTIC